MCVRVRGMIAFVDESVHEPAPGAYVLACAVLPDSDQEQEDIRAVLTSRKRFHFYKASPGRKLEIATQIGSWNILNFAYVRLGLRPSQEYARHLCVKRMLLELRDLGIDRAVFESRGQDKDRADSKTIRVARKAKKAPNPFDYKWVNGDKEPLLWIADAVASTVRADMGDVDDYANHLKSMRVFRRTLR